MEVNRHPERRLRHILSFPFIYGVLPALVLFDIFTELYHHTCFPLYGIKKVKRRDYIVFDRAKLPYLLWWEKIHCAYCSYVNGFLGYAVEIAGRTEKYWCGIKHHKRAGFHEPGHHRNFLAYGDKKEYLDFLKR
jgi:hypothetical protein